jgi:hypothetical protein
MVDAVMSSMVASVAAPLQMVRLPLPPSRRGLSQYADGLQLGGLVQYAVGKQGPKVPSSRLSGLPSWLGLASLLPLLEELHAVSHAHAVVPMSVTAKKVGFLNMTVLCE